MNIVFHIRKCPLGFRSKNDAHHKKFTDLLYNGAFGMSVLPCQHNDPLMLASQMFCVSVKSLCACSKMPDMRPVVKSWHDWINMALWCCCFFIVCVVFKIIVYLMFINTPPHANYDNSDINFTENSRYCTCGPVFWKRGFPLSLTAIFRALPYAAFISCLGRDHI